MGTTAYSALSMTANPIYFNADHATKFEHDGTIVHHVLTFNVVFRMSVEDPSEAGGAFLGVENLKFYEEVARCDTLYADSTVIGKRESDSRPHQGIVHWHTEGSRPDGPMVLEYERKNLGNKREAADAV